MPCERKQPATARARAIQWSGPPQIPLISDPHAGPTPGLVGTPQANLPRTSITITIPFPFSIPNPNIFALQRVNCTIIIELAFFCLHRNCRDSPRAQHLLLGSSSKAEQCWPSFEGNIELDEVRHLHHPPSSMPDLPDNDMDKLQSIAEAEPHASISPGHNTTDTSSSNSVTARDQAQSNVSQYLKNKGQEWNMASERKGPLTLLDLPVDILRLIIKEVCLALNPQRHHRHVPYSC